MHTNNDNVVSDNLPIYFIWFGSDVSPKYFDNLRRVAQTNKSRDIILVYSEKHLLQNNRENISSIKNINSVSEIQKRVELKRDDSTQNFFKIDVYDMELDEQCKEIYDLLNTAFKTRHFYNGKEKISFKYCIASDIIRLPLLNITGGIYLDMDTEVNEEIGEIKTQNWYSIHYYYPKDSSSYNITGNIIAKALFCSCNKFKESEFHKKISFQESMKKYIKDVSKVVNNEYKDGGRNTDPINYLSDYIRSHYVQSYFVVYIERKMQENKCNNYWWEHTDEILKYVFNDGEYCLRYKEEVGEILQSEIYQPMISDYGIDVPQSIKLKMEQGEGYNTDYNDPEQLKELGLDKQDDAISCKLEHSSLEQTENSQRER